MPGAIPLEVLTEGCRLLEDAGFGDAENPQGILGFGYGWIARNEAWTGEIGLVLWAKTGSEGFPHPALVVPWSGKRWTVPCCTFLLAPFDLEIGTALAVEGSPPLTAGCPISPAAGYATGTLACFVGPQLRYALTAAHVFGDSTDVYCGERKVGTFWPLAEDGGLIRIDDGLADEITQATPDGTPLGGPGAATLADLEAKGAVYCPTRQLTATPDIVALGCTVHVLRGPDGERVTQRGMIATSNCTQPGDSGTGLGDASNWVIGVLSSGCKEFSFFRSTEAIVASIDRWP